MLFTMPPKRRCRPAKEPESSSVNKKRNGPGGPNANDGQDNGLRTTLNAMTAMFRRKMRKKTRLMDTLLARMQVVGEQPPPPPPPPVLLMQLWNKSLFDQFKLHGPPNFAGSPDPTKAKEWGVVP